MLVQLILVCFIIHTDHNDENIDIYTPLGHPVCVTTGDFIKLIVLNLQFIIEFC